jgi:hypothetical protein
MIEQISVDLNKLYTNKLKIEDYFILFCLVHNDEDMLMKYIDTSGRIETNIFYRLRDSGFIILTDENNILFNEIKVTEKTKNLFNIQDNQKFEELFKELLVNYPKSVKRITGGTRPLHNDLSRCKKLYKLTILDRSIGSVNVELHQKIQLCVQKYYRDHLKDNKQEFMQLLATFLSQKTWEQYLEDIGELKELPKETRNHDAI